MTANQMPEWWVEREVGWQGLPSLPSNPPQEREVAEVGSEAPKWRPIDTAPKDGIGKPVDLWLRIGASPRSMGWADDFRVPDCWWDGKLGGWVHFEKPWVISPLAPSYITHWMEIPPGPAPLPPSHPDEPPR